MDMDAALARWHAWRRERALDALPAALGIVKSLPGVSHSYSEPGAWDEMAQIFVKSFSAALLPNQTAQN